MPSLEEIKEEHEHPNSRMVVQEVPTDREILTCHECETYIAEDRHDGYGWQRV